jgi:tetratricopeptide (TPR) repeat protein
MKKRIVGIIVPLMVCATLVAQENVYIEWMGENETANNYVRKGIFHWHNVEWEKSYTYFTGALEEDPTLFAPHVVLAWLSDGETKAMHVEKAKELVKGKNENSQLFVSLLELGGSENASKRHDVWTKMHEIEPDGGVIHYYYAWTTQDKQERLDEFEKFLAQKKAAGDSYFHILNALGYGYYTIGDKAKAKSYFKEYLSVYPEGYNPHDSMGEYYYNEKDYENSLIHYEKALAKFPMSNSADNKVKELKEKLGKE